MDKPHKCSVCPARFNRPWKLLGHLRCHLGKKPFKCDVESCGKEYSSPFQLNKHKKSHTDQKVVKKIPCSQAGCAQYFKTFQNLKKHLVRFHVDTICFKCGENFLSTKELRIHQSKAHLSKARCPICSKEVNESTLKQHMSSHQFICPVIGCFEVFEQYALLRKHKATAHPNPSICVHCGMTFKDKYQKFRHVKKVHKLHQGPMYNRLSLTCDSCGRVLTSKASMARHWMLIHEDRPKPEVVKEKKPRAPRKDKGTFKKSLASVLTDVKLSHDLNKAIIANNEIDESGPLGDIVLAHLQHELTSSKETVEK